jgi:hypothetical protein
MAWDVLYYRTANGAVPGIEFLTDAVRCPIPVRSALFAVLTSVVEAPPRFSGGGLWEAFLVSMIDDDPEVWWRGIRDAIPTLDPENRQRFSIGPVAALLLAGGTDWANRLAIEAREDRRIASLLADSLSFLGRASASWRDGPSPYDLLGRELVARTWSSYFAVDIQQLLDGEEGVPLKEVARMLTNSSDRSRRDPQVGGTCGLIWQARYPAVRHTLAMPWLQVEAGLDHLLQYAKRHPVDALTVLIWNGLDAEASEVDVMVETRSLGGDDPLLSTVASIKVQPVHRVSHWNQRMPSARNTTA